MKTRLLALLFTAAFLVQGCVAVIPLVVAVMDDGATVVAEVPVSAETVYAKTVELAEGNDKLTITEKDEAKHYIHVTRGDDEASLKAVPLSAHRSQMIIMTDIDGENGDGNKQLALNVAKTICDKLGVEYQVVED
ncbi:hypothetical protein [Salidesulfovibrio onnuriiensis]|uniref:hypothetical protein n=1 Tax=Salidesulfovibrio onnuriiensis TaxID=2583823 RepID=UPI0011C93EF6|nr:hypothetical protein [Salidesulfovibrio onnuriiensis]